MFLRILAHLNILHLKQMNKLTLSFFSFLLLFSGNVIGQGALKQYTAGHVFYLSLPDYMSRTVGLNDASSIQFKSVVKDVYGFVIEDNKEEMKLAELVYSSADEFFEDFIKDFLVEEDKRTVSKQLIKTVETSTFVESDVSYYDKDAETEIYYFVGIVETPTAFYKVLCWSTLENKNKFKTDFQKILYSLKD